MPRFDHSNAYRVLVDTARALAVFLLRKHFQFSKWFWLLHCIFCISGKCPDFAYSCCSMFSKAKLFSLEIDKVDRFCCIILFGGLCKVCFALGSRMFGMKPQKAGSTGNMFHMEAVFNMLNHLKAERNRRADVSTFSINNELIVTGLCVLWHNSFFEDQKQLQLYSRTRWKPCDKYIHNMLDVAPSGVSISWKPEVWKVPKPSTKVEHPGAVGMEDADFCSPPPGFLLDPYWWQSKAPPMPRLLQEIAGLIKGNP